MKKRNETNTDYWQSYSDMMASLLLIFMLIIAVAFIQLQHHKQDYEKLNEDLIKKQEEIDERERLLKEKGDQYIVLKKELEEKQKKLDKIVGVKAEIIEDLQEEFSKKKLQIGIDPKSGAILFQSDILFAFNDFELMEQGKKYLTEIAPIYLTVLLSDKYIEYISEIVIEGNCDSVGSYEYNLELSQKRAQTVSLFCMELMRGRLSSEKMEQLLRLTSITGRSNKNLIYDTNNKEDENASRRVEFKFRLKDEEMIQEMLKVLEED